MAAVANNIKCGCSNVHSHTTNPSVKQFHLNHCAVMGEPRPTVLWSLDVRFADTANYGNCLVHAVAQLINSGRPESQMRLLLWFTVCWWVFVLSLPFLVRCGNVMHVSIEIGSIDNLTFMTFYQRREIERTAYIPMSREHFYYDSSCIIIILRTCA